jgi:hypothetical protein
MSSRRGVWGGQHSLFANDPTHIVMAAKAAIHDMLQRNRSALRRFVKGCVPFTHPRQRLGPCTHS